MNVWSFEFAPTRLPHHWCPTSCATVKSSRLGSASTKNELARKSGPSRKITPDHDTASTDDDKSVSTRSSSSYGYAPYRAEYARNALAAVSNANRAPSSDPESGLTYIVTVVPSTVVEFAS